ncbi:hypothetical protein HON22_00480 [Candidatus Peregrinibacteria bacterium]|jgi:hypothetical protein|nr:hypothetical protein [Candidatus Peregrinibacteria bacterium]
MKRFFSIVILCVMAISLNAFSEEVMTGTKLDLINMDVSLFGVNLKEATRERIQQGLKNTNARILSEGADTFRDDYNTEDFFKGSQTLSFIYTEEGELAYAVYTFPSNSNVQKKRTLSQILENKYGEGTSLEVNGIEMGREWLFYNGILISLEQNPRTNKDYIMYENKEITTKYISQSGTKQLKILVSEYSAPQNAF